MQFNQLRYVLEAADKKSFSAAAKSLFVSQPSLSQQIMNLEKSLVFPCSSDIQNLSRLQRLENTLYSPPDVFSMIQSS
ncbi:MAG: LysR family transcriptional regulator [Coprococcus comes]